MLQSDVFSKLIDFFSCPNVWCQGRLAQDQDGKVCKHDSTQAAAWDLTGGIRKVCGTDMNQYLFRLALLDTLVKTKPKHLEVKPHSTTLAQCQQQNDSVGFKQSDLLDWLGAARDYSLAAEKGAE